MDIAENGRRVVIELNGLLNAELYASDPVLVVQALVCRRHVKTDPVAADEV